MSGYEQYWRQREFLYEFVLEMGLEVYSRASGTKLENDLLKLFECSWETKGFFCFCFDCKITILPNNGKLIIEYKK